MGCCEIVGPELFVSYVDSDGGYTLFTGVFSSREVALQYGKVQRFVLDRPVYDFDPGVSIEELRASAFKLNLGDQR